MAAHVEIIRPAERLDPSLGGTGYVGPENAATPAELVASLDQAGDLPVMIWKVSRASVHFKGPAFTRRIQIAGVADRLTVTVIGANRTWWFVSVDVAEARRVLTDGR